MMQDESRSILAEFKRQLEPGAALAAGPVLDGPTFEIDGQKIATAAKDPGQLLA